MWQPMKSKTSAVEVLYATLLNKATILMLL